MGTKNPHIVVLGAGFGGLTFCQEFHHPEARVTVVDRQNHHLFQPLLYQVATAGLAAPDIAQPIRSILADKPNMTVLLDQVVDVSLPERKVICEKNTLSYDYLLLALGGCTSYFGHPEWEQFAPGLKTLDDALRLRRHILLSFEQAENAITQEARDRLMTIVVVGGGPTGVELAGAFAELTRHVLVSDFRHIDPRQAHVILIEAGSRILSAYPPELSESAKQQLSNLGVDVCVGMRVLDIKKGCVVLEERTILAENIVWAAGVSAIPLTRKLGVEIDRAGRVKVQPDLSLSGYSEVFVIGDMAAVVDKDGQVVPGIAPAAMQMANYVARMLELEMASGGMRRPSRLPFDYFDKGTMATIGRSAAVAKIGKLQFSGFLAWLSWLVIHLVFLVGFRNKMAVLFNWSYSYFTYKRGARIITGLEEETELQKCAVRESLK
jgi:NADH:ubiquinone reductase (H+-translocating)